MSGDGEDWQSRLVGGPQGRTGQRVGGDTLAAGNTGESPAAGNTALDTAAGTAQDTAAGIAQDTAAGTVLDTAAGTAEDTAAAGERTDTGGLG